jgi:glucose-1-phosphate adenylyltransferase
VDGVAERSVISPGVYIAEGATVIDSVIMNDCQIGPGAVIRKAILDKEVVVGENVKIGCGEKTWSVPNQTVPDKLNTGLTVIGKEAYLPEGLTVGQNVIIEPGAKPEHFKSQEVQSGETVKVK